MKWEEIDDCQLSGSSGRRVGRRSLVGGRYLLLICCPLWGVAGLRNGFFIDARVLSGFYNERELQGIVIWIRFTNYQNKRPQPIQISHEKEIKYKRWENVMIMASRRRRRRISWKRMSVLTRLDTGTNWFYRPWFDLQVVDWEGFE